MYETRFQRLVSGSAFLSRLSRNILQGIAILCCSLGLGMTGYHHLESMSWVEAFENASMILSGMGPVSDMHSDSGKIFAGLYALFSGIVFLVVMGLVIAPIVHRFLHKFHSLDDKHNS